MNSNEAAADPSFGRVFLHLPVPHPPPIVSRTEAKSVAQGRNNYFDNLALADWTLGELRRSVEQAGLAGNTTLVVTSDHGLRSVWRNGPDWTEEEDALLRTTNT